MTATTRQQNAPAWAEALRTARGRLGLSQRELARRLGLAQETIRTAELGRPPRHSTLMAYLTQIPGLQPGDLLRGPLPPPPVASEAVWSAYRVVLGFSARSLQWKRSESPDGSWTDLMRIRGAALIDDAAGQPELRALAQALCVGGVGFVRDLPVSIADSGCHQLVDKCGQHRFKWSSTRAGRRLSYAFRGRLGTRVAMEIPIDYCVEELALIWERPDASLTLSIRPRVNPEPIPPGSAEERLAERTHPTAPLERSGKRVSWRPTFPIPGLTYGLDEVPAGDVPPARTWSLARTLRQARAHAGLTMREVAQAAGTSAATLAYAEAGRDPRASTLEGYLLALPNLVPQDLLPACAPGGTLKPTELWDLMRDLYGYEIAAVRKTVTIARDGSSTTTIDTLDLRPLRATLADFRYRSGLHRGITQASESVLESVESQFAEDKVRFIRRTEGPVVHEFRFPRSFARGGITHRREYSGEPYPLRQADLRRSLSPSEPAISGAVVPIYHPVRRATLIVHLPVRLTTAVRPYAYPSCVPAATPLPLLSRALSAPPCRVVQGVDGTVLSISVVRPLIGTRYAITWDVPV